MKKPKRIVIAVACPNPDDTSWIEQQLADALEKKPYLAVNWMKTRNKQFADTRLSQRVTSVCHSASAPRARQRVWAFLHALQVIWQSRLESAAATARQEVNIFLFHPLVTLLALDKPGVGNSTLINLLLDQTRLANTDGRPDLTVLCHRGKLNSLALSDQNRSLWGSVVVTLNPSKPQVASDQLAEALSELLPKRLNHHSPETPLGVWPE